MGLPRWCSGKDSPCQFRRPSFDPWVGKTLGGGHGKPLQYSCLEKHHGQKSLASYTPWDSKELNMTEQLN